MLAIGILATGVIFALDSEQSVSIQANDVCKIDLYNAFEPVFGYVSRQRDVYGDCLFNLNYTDCLNTTGPNTDCLQKQRNLTRRCVLGTESYQSYEKIGERNVQKNRTICRNAGFTINSAGAIKKINFDKAGYYCTSDINIITCDSVYDGNGDGICDSGESCVKFEATPRGIFEVYRKIDSKALKSLEVE